MVVIKRYPNRKLYDTEAKHYVSLDIIAVLIRQGEDVQVLDYVTGEDVTNLVLVQIIAEQERKQGGSLPQPVLTGLIKAGEETLASLRRGLNSPLDLLRQVDEEIERRLDGLISRGELGEEEGTRLRDKLLASREWVQGAIRPGEEALQRWLGNRGLPTRADIQALTDQVDALERELDELGQRPDEDAS